MIVTTVKIDGMMCGMCEAHVNDVIRRTFSVKTVKASYKKGIAELVTTEVPDIEKLRAAIVGVGYRVLEISHKPYQKKSIFSKLFE